MSRQSGRTPVPYDLREVFSLSDGKRQRTRKNDESKARRRDRELDSVQTSSSGDKRKESEMNVINELKLLKDEVLTIHDMKDKCFARNHINEIIKGIESEGMNVPDFIKAKVIEI